MALTAAQIVALANQDSSTQGYTSQAGELLNVILQELCQNYDLDSARGTTVLSFSPSQAPNLALYPNVQLGAGPYALPSDFLRMVDDKDATWYNNGVPYPMIPCDLSEYDNLVQQAGQQAYPYLFATDTTQSPPNLLVWPPPNGAYNCLIRYRRQMPDIATPESSATVPWFPNSQYLRTRLAGEMMKIADDDRWERFLGDGHSGAQGILNRYLKMEGDKNDRSMEVKLDRRRFHRNFSSLKNTKTIGWVVILALMFGLGGNIMGPQNGGHHAEQKILLAQSREAPGGF